jgi:hypothetical protein
VDFPIPLGATNPIAWPFFSDIPSVIE